MGGGDSDTDIYIEGRPLPRTNDEATITWYRLVSQDYFDLMGITLQKGRVFSASEAAPVVVVNQTAAARLWPGEDPNRPSGSFRHAWRCAMVHHRRHRT